MEIIAAHGTVMVVLAVIFGLYMTWGVGANDLANAMGTSVGAGAVSVKQAVAIAIIFEFSGAVLAGGNVTKTIRKGIIDPSGIVGTPEILVYGMLASLLAAAVWLMIASAKGWPVSPPIPLSAPWWALPWLVLARTRSTGQRSVKSLPPGLSRRPLAAPSLFSWS